MDDLDRIVLRAYELSVEDWTDEVENEFEELVPTLVAAGFAATDGDTWHWTSAGIARAKHLSGERD